MNFMKLGITKDMILAFEHYKHNRIFKVLVHALETLIREWALLIVINFHFLNSEKWLSCARR